MQISAWYFITVPRYIHIPDIQIASNGRKVLMKPRRKFRVPALHESGAIASAAEELLEPQRRRLVLILIKS